MTHHLIHRVQDQSRWTNPKQTRGQRTHDHGPIEAMPQPSFWARLLGRDA